MVTKILGFLIIVLTIASCSDEENKTFSSSIDEKYGWTNGFNTIVNAPSHSGSLCSKIDSINPYSFGFYYAINQISKNALSKAKYSAWIKVDKLPTNISLVSTITSNQNKVKHQWIGFKVNEKIKTVNTWVQISGDIIIPTNLPPDAVLWFYAWSPNGDIGYVDDLEISFE